MFYRNRSALILSFMLTAVCAAVLAPAPCAANISVSGELTQLFRAESGQVISGEVKLVNSGDTVLDTRLYLTDYMYHADGTNIYGEPGKSERSSAGWMTLQSELVAVPPKSTMAVPFSIRVPDGVAVGSHWCLIMVEQVDQSPPGAAPKDAAATQPTGPAMGIVARVRYGIQVIVDVGQGAANVDILDAGLSRDAEGTYVLHLDVKNTGEVRLVPTMKVWAYDAQGQNIGAFEGSKVGLVPGSSARFRTALKGIVPGEYAVLIVFESSEGSWGVQYDLKLQ